jgi:sirohydrochlorin ferrochelatase
VVERARLPVTAALIVAHGQPSDPGPAGRAVDRLAAAVARHLPGWQVAGATLAEPGVLAERLARLGQGVVYPLFMACGWFTQSQLPDRMAAAGATRGWRIAAPFGCDAAVQDLAVAQAVAAEAPEVILAAHGSGRSDRPAAIALALAGRIALATGRPARAAFIDQAPRLADLRGLVPGAVCLPFFALPGGHVTDDLPAALAEAGLSGPILPPVGGDPAVPALIARAVLAAGSGHRGRAARPRALVLP